MARSPSTKSGLSFETGMLSFSRSIQITEGLFFATQEANPSVATPLAVLEKGVRGQSSEDKAKNPGLSNPQSVEYAIVPQGHDGVKLDFSIRFMPSALKPHACNDTEVGASYVRLVDAYRRAGGFHVLAGLYLWNIANARFAWRNRYQSDSMSVVVTTPSGEVLRFDPARLSLDSYTGVDGVKAAVVSGSPEAVDGVVQGIANGLSNANEASYTLKVSWHAAMEAGQEVFPSQEYLRDEKVDKQLSRVLAKLPTQHRDQVVPQASMHSQKIGAAVRHIDIWHDSPDHSGPIAVNPYGGVQETSAVLRAPASKRGFYDIRKKADVLMAKVEGAQTSDEIDGDVHFFVANLVRGGVFGSSKKGEEAA